jgi:hypothetical protein
MDVLFSRRVSAVALLALAACSGPADDPEGLDPSGPAAAELRASRHGLVVLEHDQGEAGVALRGQFIDSRGLGPSDALGLLALPEVEWSSGHLEPGECRVHASEVELLDDTGRRSLSLLSAGALRVRAEGVPGEGLKLSPAALPRVLFAVRGVVYDAYAPEVLPYGPGARYTVRADGDEIGRFEAYIDAPETPKLVGAERVEQGIRVHFEASADVRLMLARQDSGETRAVVCRPTQSDQGFFPAELVEAVGRGALEVAVVRTHRRSVQVEGLDRLDLLFVSRDRADVPGGAVEATPVLE